MASNFTRTLHDLGLDEYREELLARGYSNWEQLMTITEQELLDLEIRPGSRRKLQRAIARFFHWPDSQPLPSAAELERFRQRKFSALTSRPLSSRAPVALRKSKPTSSTTD
ncbi:BgTH12-06003 [Blumeria graminis f. sp. triticale]|uniref:BgtA-21293 n=3 Tax=Blumeria graminis TaxID=34373 RepID=A0A9X9MKZ7_BLUGR|nr:hypothetical protein BGT96224_A21293 [Blumeria graminis f. sp. tritici 96224]CAD6504270.1 BgTH12-06003 [Blumeria graminis f. sp. triticale]VDB91079.1 BgtA-21293 [Blumeria graminis f. sp. tritici]